MNKVTIAIAAVTILVIIIGVYLITRSSMDGTYRFKENNKSVYLIIKDKTLKVIENGEKGPYTFVETSEPKVYQANLDEDISLKFFLDNENKKLLNAIVFTNKNTNVKSKITLLKISDKALTKAEADLIV